MGGPATAPRSRLPSASIGLVLAMGALLPIHGARAQAPDEHLVYGSLRLGAQLSDAAGDASGLRNYSSRVGYRGFFGLPFENERTGLVFQAELGFQDDEVGADGTRLLLGGIKGPAGQLSYGRQWSAFYTTVGSFMDVGISESGFGYEGSERVSESLQYSGLFGDTYVQADAIRDEQIAGGGFERLQVGVEHRRAVWRFGVAGGLNRGSGLSVGDAATRRARDGDKKGLCDYRGIDCVGVSIGWSVDDLGWDLGANHVRSSTDHGNGVAFTVRWWPNQFTYYAEVSAFDASDTTRKAIAGGIEYTFNRYGKWFGEFSVVGKGGAGDDTDGAVLLGLKIDLDCYGLTFDCL